MNISAVQNYNIAALQLKQQAQTPKVQQNKTFAYVTSPIERPFATYPAGYVPYQINFEGGDYQKLPQILKLKSLKNLPCIYCGTKMIPSSVYYDLQFANNKVGRTVTEFINAIKPSVLSLDDAGKNIYKTIENIAKEKPDAKVGTYLDKIAEKTEVPNFMKKLAERDLTTKEYTQRIIEIISPYEEGLMPVEKALFKEIKIANAGETKKSLQDIMNDLRGLTIDILNKKQNKVIADIETTAHQELRGATKGKVLDITRRAKELLKDDASSGQFKRKDFIKDIKRIKTSNTREQNVINNLVKIAEQTPNSEQDLGAFVAKYSCKLNKNSSLEAKQRSNEEIAQRLINPSIASVEHIRPQETYKNIRITHTVPKDNIANLSLAHRSCNSERDNLSLAQYIHQKPEVKSFIQKHVDFVSDAIKKGELTGMDDYPQQLKTAYEEGSHGAIKITLPSDK